MSREAAADAANPIRHTTEIEVRYVETDRMGFVHHSIYLQWFEVARTHLCLHTGHHYDEIEKHGYNLVLSRTEVRHFAPATYGDVVHVTVWIERLGSRLTEFSYEARIGDDLLATGTTEHVWYETASRKARRIPELFREPFRRLAGLTPAEKAKGEGGKHASDA